MAIIGIDFGTTNSVISFFEKDSPIIIPNLRGSRLTPSIVSIDKKGRVLVGESAKNQILFNPEGTVTEVKRKIGTNYIYKIYGNSYSPPEISSFIIKDLKNSAEKYLGEFVNQAIITVPAHFSQNQRQELKNICQLADLEILNMINEPTAAALSYAYSLGNNQNIIVYDLGGGTFDVSILDKRDLNFDVKATVGDSNLGGKDIDLLLFDKILKSFESENGIDLKENVIIQKQLLDSVENAKKELSISNETNIIIPFLSADSKSFHLNYNLTIEEFNDLIEPMVDKSIQLLDQAIEDSKIKKEDINGIIYSGGSSRIPLIHQKIEKKFGFKDTYKVNPDEIVSLGASVASDSTKKSYPISFNDVSYFTIGIEADNDVYIPLIKRNTPLPVSKKKIFTTVVDNQEEVEIHILQGESKVASENLSLSKFLLSKINMAKKGTPKIEVLFNIDKDGFTHISARDLDTGQKNDIDLVINPNEDTKFSEKEIELKRIEDIKYKIEKIVRKVDIKDDFLLEYKELNSFITESIKSENLIKIKESKEALQIFYNEIKEISFN